MSRTIRNLTLGALIAAAAAALTLAACRTNNIMYDPTKPHHTPEGFRNNYYDEPRPSFWKWQRERWAKGLPKIPEGGYQFELLRPDLTMLKANRSTPTLTWVGHATFLLQLNGVNILTDPHFTERASPLSFAGPKRVVAPGIALADLPHIDAVVISHSHYDHLDRPTVKALARQAGGAPQYVVPLGLKKWLEGEGIDRATELDWWQSTTVNGLTFTLTPVHHWSARGLHDRNRTLWGGFAIEAPSFRFFFAGDTGYSPDFKDIGKRFGSFDLAALPIGAYEPRWFMKQMHTNPEEAVQIHRDLNARWSVAMHWGTFILTDEMLDEPPRKLREARDAAGIAADRFFVMKHGETRDLSGMMRSSDAHATAAEPSR